MDKMTEAPWADMRYYNSMLDAIGNTPLIRLNRVANDVPPLVLAKIEMFNPGGSVKDRIGPAMIEYCERQGLLRPGGTIVEPTSGNTGHGLAIAAAIKGYHCIFVMTDKVSEEKRSLLRAYGAGGTISGIARFLKEQNPGVKVIGADPPGSVFSGDTPKPYKVEGIGMEIFPPNYDPSVVDEVIRIEDRTSFYWARRLAREEGMLVGGSSGTALAAALIYARRLTPGDVVVVLFPDTGRGYLSKQFNDTWMRENNMLVQAETDEPTLHDVLTYRRTHSRTMPLVVSVAPTDSFADAVELLRRYGISQTPVLENGCMVGSLTENLLLRHLASGERLSSKVVRDFQGPPFPQLQADTPAQEAYTLFSSGQSAVAVMNSDALEGIVTKSDLLEFWAHTVPSTVPVE